MKKIAVALLGLAICFVVGGNLPSLADEKNPEARLTLLTRGPDLEATYQQLIETPLGEDSSGSDLITAYQLLQDLSDYRRLKNDAQFQKIMYKELSHIGLELSSRGIEFRLEENNNGASYFFEINGCPVVMRHSPGRRISYDAATIAARTPANQELLAETLKTINVRLDDGIGFYNLMTQRYGLTGNAFTWAEPESNILTALHYLLFELESSYKNE